MPSCPFADVSPAGYRKPPNHIRDALPHDLLVFSRHAGVRAWRGRTYVIVT